MEACWPSTPPGTTSGKRARLPWYYASLKYGDFAHGTSRHAPRRFRPGCCGDRHRAVEAGRGADMARQGRGRGAVRLSPADVGTHPRRLLESRLGRAVQRQGVWSRLGNKPVQGEDLDGGRVRAADGDTRTAADQDERHRRLLAGVAGRPAPPP